MKNHFISLILPPKSIFIPVTFRDSDDLIKQMSGIMALESR